MAGTDQEAQPMTSPLDVAARLTEERIEAIRQRLERARKGDRAPERLLDDLDALLSALTLSEQRRQELEDVVARQERVNM